MNENVLKSIIKIELEKTNNHFFQCNDPWLEIIINPLSTLYELFLQWEYKEFIKVYENNYFFKHEKWYEWYPHLEYNVQCVFDYDSFDPENFEAIKSILFAARMVDYLKKYIDSNFV